MLTLTPGTTSLATLETLWRSGASARLDPAAREGVEAAAAGSGSHGFHG